MTACTKILFGGEYLSYSNAMIAEQLVISVNEFGLTHCREQLALIYAVEFPEGISLRPEATAPEEIRITSTPALCKAAI